MGLAVACSDDGSGMSMDPTGPGTAGTPPIATAGTTATPMAGAGTAGTGIAGRTAAGSGGAGRGAAGSTPPAGMAGTTAGGTAGMPPVSGSSAMAGTGAAGMMAEAGTGGVGGEMPSAGTGMPAAGTGGKMGDGMCCPTGDCICRDEPPASLTSMQGKYTTKSYTVSAGCVYYPEGAEPPFSAVAISDGFVGTGGCGIAQTGRWGPLLASHGIVTMIINTSGGDQPNARGRKLNGGIEAFKAENMKSGSPLMGKLAGRYGTGGFSMGGGGTSYATQDDTTLKSSLAIMPWGPVRTGVKTPTLVICGASDGIASCSAHGNGLYSGISEDVPKMRVTVSGGHNGQPSAGGGKSGEYGLAFLKVYLDGDERWKPLLTGAKADATNIK